MARAQWGWLLACDTGPSKAQLTATFLRHPVPKRYDKKTEGKIRKERTPCHLSVTCERTFCNKLLLASGSSSASGVRISILYGIQIFFPKLK